MTDDTPSPMAIVRARLIARHFDLWGSATMQRIYHTTSILAAVDTLRAVNDHLAATRLERHIRHRAAAE